MAASVSRSQFGLFVPSVDIFSVLLPDNIDLSIKCQRERLVNAMSTPFLNSEIKVDLLRVTEIQFLYKSHFPSTNQNL